jgi:hypothetical protein
LAAAILVQKNRQRTGMSAGGLYFQNAWRSLA